MEKRLLGAIKAKLLEFEALLTAINGEWGYEDLVYRFYHQSFKVFRVQETTTRIVEAVRTLVPHVRLNAWFVEIVVAGTGRTFEKEDNFRWSEATRPMIEAFLHARYFLEMICKYGRELDEPPAVLPSGWAALLELYGLR